MSDRFKIDEHTITSRQVLGSDWVEQMIAYDGVNCTQIGELYDPNPRKTNGLSDSHVEVKIGGKWVSLFDMKLVENEDDKVPVFCIMYQPITNFL
jgi:hypothetical protein